MLDRKNLYKPINSKFLFYDYELKDCFKAIKDLYDVFKRVHKRFDRKETMTVSKSVCDFMQLERDKLLYPYILYDFKCHSSRVCIIQRCKRYYVYVSVPNYRPIFDKYKKEWKEDDFYGGYDRLSDTVPLFVSIVNFICVNGDSVEIPF